MGPRREVRAPSGPVEREFAIAKTPIMLKFFLIFSFPYVKAFEVGLFSPFNNSSFLNLGYARPRIHHQAL
jgi:hypothetical protein